MRHHKQMAIRVLHVIGNLGLGGAQVLLKQIVERSDPSRMEHFVYPLREPNQMISIEGRILHMKYPPYDPRKFPAILHLCKKEKIDLLHAHLHKPITGCLLTTYFQKIPVIVHEHGPICRKGIQYALYRFLLRGLWRRATAVIANSGHIANLLHTKIGIEDHRLYTLPNAVDFSAFDAIPSPKQARQQLAIPQEALVLGFAGRLHSVKGADIALRVLQHVRHTHANALLILAGTGPRLADLQTLARTLGIEKSVRFLGFCKSIPPVMAAADIALIPSRQEPFGLVGLEWMRARVPVITSGVEGLKEFITNGQTGLVVPENTPTEYVAAVEKILNSAKEKETLIEQAFEQTRHYEIGPYLETLHTLYRNILSTGRITS